MSGKLKIATIHLVSTIWFILCVGYILVIALLQAGVKWWIVFSLSGHGLLLALLVMSLYLFAIFRGISSTQKLNTEHPITSSEQYAFFYALTPFLGGLGGLFGMLGADSTTQFISGITLGTLGTTFSIWVIIDPVLGLLEMFLPESRRHYKKRQLEAKVQRERKQKERDNLLKEAMEKANSNRNNWHEQLKPQAEKLAELLTTDMAKLKQAEREAAGIGIKAWQLGGLNCMRELRDMALDISKNNNKDTVDYITFWWDGIGGWRNTSLC